MLRSLYFVVVASLLSCSSVERRVKNRLRLKRIHTVVGLDEVESISLGMASDQTGLTPAVQGEVIAFLASASGEV